MSRKIKAIKRFNQNFKNFSFSNLTNKADQEYIDLTALLDEIGNTIEEVKFAADGHIEEKNTYQFNDNSKLLNHELLYAIENVTEKRILERNAKGLLVSEIKYYGNDPGEKTTYEYDEKDNVTSITHFDEEGEFITKENITYDDTGSLKERTVYNSDNKIISRITLTPPSENKIEQTEYDSDGKMISKSVIKFNEKGQEISSAQTTPDGKLISGVINTFDERGNIIEKVYKDFYSKTIRYEYNENNLLISQEMFDDSGLLLRKNMYEYDDDGNVISEQTYEMDTTRAGRDKHYGTRYEYQYY